MQRLAIMLKSYGPDLPYAKRFVESYEAFNRESIPLYIVVPAEDEPAFEAAFGGAATVLSEELFGSHLVDYRIHGNSPGYMNQQIIKLAFAELGLAANYLCADSDAVFLRPFHHADFIAHDDVPYTFLTEDAELRVEPEYYRDYWAAREQMLLTLRRFLGLPEFPYRTCHNMSVFSANVLESLRRFLDEQGLTYAQALNQCPYEFSWYNFWLERDQTIEVVAREPIFKMLHSASQHMEYVLKGVTNDDLARGYVGIVVNSGYSREHGVVSFGEPAYKSIGSYMTQGEMVRALTIRLLRRAPRVQRLLGVKVPG